MPKQWWRRILLIVLVPLVSLSVVVSTLTIWSHQTLLSTDRWVAATALLIDDPRVVSQLSAFLAEQIVSTLAIQTRAREALPDRAGFLAAPLADSASRFVQTQATRFLSSDAGKQAWVTTNRLAHEQLIAALRGESQFLGTANGMVSLDLLALPVALLQQIEPNAPGLVERVAALPDPAAGQSAEDRRRDLARSLGVEVPPNFGQVPLFPTEQLQAAQRGVQLFDALAVASPLVTILLAVATLLLFRDRWMGALVLSCGMLLAFALARILLPEAIGFATSQIPRAGAQDFVAAAVGDLLASLATVLMFGVLVSGAAAVTLFLLRRSRLQGSHVPATEAAPAT